MTDYDFLTNGKHTNCKQTVVRFNILGEPKKADNPAYIPSDNDYYALREVFPWLISAVKKCPCQ